MTQLRNCSTGAEWMQIRLHHPHSLHRFSHSPHQALCGAKLSVEAESNTHTQKQPCIRHLGSKYLSFLPPVKEELPANRDAAPLRGTRHSASCALPQTSPKKPYLPPNTRAPLPLSHRAPQLSGMGDTRDKEGPSPTAPLVPKLGS